VALTRSVRREDFHVSAAAVIPVRNRPALIAEAIGSIQRQTQPLEEIIVVDDGSTDATPDVVMRLSQDDSRIRLVALATPGGASAARNAGIEVSRSEWISFLDSDDQWMPTKHEMQLRALAAHPHAVASFTGIRYQRRRRYHDRSPSQDITTQALRRFNHLGSTSCAMVRRDVLRQVGAFDASLPSCQDWDLWIRLRRAGDFAIVPDPLVVFNQTETFRISRNRTGVLAGHAQLLARALADVTDDREKRMIAAYHHLRLSQIHHWDFMEPYAGAIAALRSLMLHPTRGGAALLFEAPKTGLRRMIGSIGHRL
jgi:GT2 family glycosyltransferase